MLRLNVRTHRTARRRGVTALLAMLFLMLITVLSLAMFHMASSNVQTSANYSDLARAQSAAESGLRWTAYRFATMQRPRDLAGSVTPNVAYNIWNRTDGMRDRFAQNLALVRDQSNLAVKVSAGGDSVMVTSQVPTDLPGATFTVWVRQLSGRDALGNGDPADERFIRVTSTGKYRNAVRSVSMDFQIEKRAKFAVIGKVPIQIGRNTIIDGPIGMATASKYPPVLILPDFAHLSHSILQTKLTKFNTYLRGTSSVNGRTVKNHATLDNRISINNQAEYIAATRQGYRDVNGDAYIDEYDLVLETFDTNKDGAIDQREFTNPSTGKLYDEQLFGTIDGLGAPRYDEDKNGNDSLDRDEDTIFINNHLDQEPPRDGYQDNKIDNRDGYAKIRGQIFLATTMNDWQSRLAAGQSVQDYFLGPIAVEDKGASATKFGAGPNELLDLNPQNFEQAALGFRDKTATGTPMPLKQVGLIANAVLAPEDAALYSIPHVRVKTVGGTTLVLNSIIPTSVFNAARDQAVLEKKTPPTSEPAPTTIDEKTPNGSTTHQAMYRRPWFRGVTFRSVRIPKGINALFDKCKFEKVTFIEVERDIKTSSGAVTTSSSEGGNFARRMKTGSFTADTVLTATNSYGFSLGNNIRFDNCIFEGPLASNYATAYTHFANSWEFTNSAIFNNKEDQTATIVAPQTNIEMGSFADPVSAPSTLIGVVVAGNLDIRGTSSVDGSIIVTGDGAGNTTLGYFGASDGDSSTSLDLTKNGNGWGRLSIRYNDMRALPDGINIPIEVVEKLYTYREGTR